MLCACCNSELKRVNNNNNWEYYNCKNCGFWTSRTTAGGWPEYDYTDAPMFDEHADQSWDSLVNEAKVIMKHKFEMAGIKPGRFLDVGCSEGVYVSACSQLGWESIGYEVDSVKVSRAKSKGFDVMGPDDFFIEESSVDFILIRHVLEHVPDFIELTKGFSKYLKKDGILCVEFPNQASLNSLLTRSKIKNGRFLGHVYPPTHIHGFEPKTLSYMSSEIGMKCKKVITYSPSDPTWSIASQYHKRGFIPMVHNLTSRFGFGENLAAFLSY